MKRIPFDRFSDKRFYYANKEDLKDYIGTVDDEQLIRRIYSKHKEVAAHLTLTLRPYLSYLFILLCGMCVLQSCKKSSVCASHT